MQRQPVLDPVNQSLIDHLTAEGGPPIYTLTPDEARTILLRAQSGAVRKPHAQVKDLNVATGRGTLRLRIIRPDHAIDRGPVIMYFHGAGWVMGDATTHDRLVKELAVGADATVVFVDYDRAPEHCYPVAIEQAYAATRKMGVCVVIGVTRADVQVSINANEMVYAEKTLMGSLYGSSRPRIDILNLIEMHQSGKLLLDELLTRTYPLEQINTAYTALERGEVARSLVLA